jgi:hypothetical protein
MYEEAALEYALSAFRFQLTVGEKPDFTSCLKQGFEIVTGETYPIIETQEAKMPKGYEANRLVLAGVARDFVEDGATKSEHFFSKDDIAGEDPVKLPKGMQVRVRFDYFPEDPGVPSEV